MSEYKPVMWKDEMPEAGGEDWMKVLLDAAQRCSRKRLRKAYADRVRENWHGYDRVVYDYYGYEEEMMKQKEAEKKSQIYQLQEICKSELHDPIAKYSIPREIVAMGEEQERLEAAERSSRKRNLKAYMDRVHENWHDRLVCDYYGYEEERTKQEEDETKYKEVEGDVRPSKRMKLVSDGSYSSTRSRGKENKRAPDDDSVEEDVRTKMAHLDRYKEVKVMKFYYNILTHDTTNLPEDQLALHLKVCKKIRRKLGMPL